MMMIQNYVKCLLIFAWFQHVCPLLVESNEVTQFVKLYNSGRGPAKHTIPFKLAPVLNIEIEYDLRSLIEVQLKKNPDSDLPLGVLHDAVYRIETLYKINRKTVFSSLFETENDYFKFESQKRIGSIHPIQLGTNDYGTSIPYMETYIHISSDLIDQWRQEINNQFRGIGQLDENEVQELDFCREQTLVFYADEEDQVPIESVQVNLVQLAQVSEYFRARLRATNHHDGKNHLDCQSPLKLVHPSFDTETVQDLLQYMQGRYFSFTHFSQKSRDYLERMQAICDFLMIDSLNQLISQLF